MAATYKFDQIRSQVNPSLIKSSFAGLNDVLKGISKDAVDYEKNQQVMAQQTLENQRADTRLGLAQASDLRAQQQLESNLATNLLNQQVKQQQIDGANLVKTDTDITNQLMKSLRGMPNKEALSTINSMNTTVAQNDLMRAALEKAHAPQIAAEEQRQTEITRERAAIDEILKEQRGIISSAPRINGRSSSSSKSSKKGGLFAPQEPGFFFDNALSKEDKATYNNNLPLNLQIHGLPTNFNTQNVVSAYMQENALDPTNIDDVEKAILEADEKGLINKDNSYSNSGYSYESPDDKQARAALLNPYLARRQSNLSRLIGNTPKETKANIEASTGQKVNTSAEVLDKKLKQEQKKLINSNKSQNNKKPVPDNTDYSSQAEAERGNYTNTIEEEPYVFNYDNFNSTDYPQGGNELPSQGSNAETQALMEEYNKTKQSREETFSPEELANMSRKDRTNYLLKNRINRFLKENSPSLSDIKDHFLIPQSATLTNKGYGEDLGKYIGGKVADYKANNDAVNKFNNRYALPKRETGLSKILDKASLPVIPGVPTYTQIGNALNKNIRTDNPLGFGVNTGYYDKKPKSSEEDLAQAEEYTAKILEQEYNGKRTYPTKAESIKNQVKLLKNYFKLKGIKGVPDIEIENWIKQQNKR